MAKESSQKWLKRNRPPRVQIQYEVEINGAQKKVELPFIMGVMADLSGSRKHGLEEVRDRDFTEVDQDNFDDYLKAQRPTLQFNVENTLTDEGGKVPVNLEFSKLDDFSPAAVVDQVESLKKLREARTKLMEFGAKLDGKFGAQDTIQKILSDADLLGQAAGSKKAEGATASSQPAPSDSGGGSSGGDAGAGGEPSGGESGGGGEGGDAPESNQ